MKRATLAAVAVAVLAAVHAPTAASADPTRDGTASAFGASVSITDQNVTTQPEVKSTQAEEDASETVIGIPGAPLAVSGTLTASAAVHADGDIASGLLQNKQAAAGPYNARGFGEIEGAQVLLDSVGEGVSLLRADAIRAEAVAVCAGETVTYDAQSEIINLQIGGEDVPLNAPLQDLIDGISEVLTTSGLNQVVDIQRNVVTKTAEGASVDALRVTVLSAAGDNPLGTVVLGHAEVSGVVCGAAATPPECSDDVDNADAEDTLADEDDPGCHTDGDPGNPDSYDPTDDDETDAPTDKPECSDGVDNADSEDTLADEADPGCHTDGDPDNPDSYDPTDDDESNGGLPRTGGTDLLGPAMLLGLGAVAARRFFRGALAS